MIRGDRLTSCMTCYPLLRTTVLLAAQGWRDHDDADALRHDPAMRLASSSSAGLTPLVVEKGLASEPTLSRFTAIMAAPRNLVVLREGVLELAARGLRALNGERRLARVTLDVDSLPIEVHGRQPKAEWNGHYNARVYHPLVTSIAETGDMLDARLRPGNFGTADGALSALSLLARIQKHTAHAGTRSFHGFSKTTPEQLDLFDALNLPKTRLTALPLSHFWLLGLNNINRLAVSLMNLGCTCLSKSCHPTGRRPKSGAYPACLRGGCSISCPHSEARTEPFSQ